MAMIEKMSVLGIRSFGPEDSDQQVIQFQHPLTLILGPNGAGKTTIIECLKYATTGEHPLKTKGGAFVHDPKLARESEVRARVRLKCHTIRGNQILVDRGLTAIQKQKGDIQIRTLDGVITKIRNGEKVTITSKCAELNKEMVSALGVSKAVLDNVIFCHQEESNWPLSEGKAVKQKFDDIFAATRYIKALDEIRNIQKTQKAIMKEENVALGFLKTNSERAAETKKNLESAERKLEAAKKVGKQVTSQLSPIEERLRELSRKRADVIKLDGQLGALKSRKSQMMEDKKKLHSRINNIFHGTDEQLTELLRDQQKILKTKRDQQSDYEAQIGPLQENLKFLGKRKTSLSIEQGKLQQEVKNADEKRTARNDLVRKYGEEVKIDVSGLKGDEISSKDIEQFQVSFKKVIANEAKECRIQKIQFESESKEAEENYQRAWQRKTELIEGIKHQKKRLLELKEKLVKNNRDLNRIQTATDNDQLDILQEQLQVAQSELDKAEASINVDQTRIEIKKLNAKKLRMQRQFEALEGDISEMQKSSATLTKIDILCKDKAAKDEMMNRLKNKSRDALSLCGLVSHSSFPGKTQVARWITGKEKELKTAQSELDAKRSQSTKLSTEHSILTNQIKEKQKRRDDLDETLLDTCGSGDIEHDMRILENEIKEMQGSKGLTDGIQHIYRKFLRKLKIDDEEEKKEVPCPLCQRLFDEPAEIDELVSILENRLQAVPRKLENQARELEKKETRLKLMQENKPLKFELDKISSVELPEFAKKSKELSSQMSKLKISTDNLEEKCSQLSEEEKTAKSCLPNVVQIEALMIEIRDLSQEISYLESQIPTSSDARSLEELMEERKKMSDEMKTQSQLIDDTRKEMETKSDSILSLKDKVNEIKGEKLQLASDVQKCEQLQEVQKSLSRDAKQIKSEIEQNQKDLIPVESEVEELGAKKNQIVGRNEEKLNELNRQKQVLETKFRELESMNRDIKRFDDSGVEEKLEKNKTLTKDIETKTGASSKKIEKLREDIIRLQKELATCTDRQRDLEDNSALRERERDIEKVKKDITAKEEELNGMDAGKLEEENRNLNEEHQKLSKERERGREREVHLRENASTLRRELNKDDYKHADERYKESLIKCTTLDLASDDLGKYYKALDRAVMRFHQIKMDEINKIIKDLWQETYRGKDIDYIQICSSEDTGGGTRRTYNYRVVMYAGDVGMDMRGRCSAGQKVLASLVIRLALAESFCINCGILALDEPTTNLDRDNIESLAKALVSIIESRSRQRNFQLVVITHDEDFVELLGRSNYVDHFFRIEKDDRSRSRILKCPIRDLNP